MPRTVGYFEFFVMAAMVAWATASAAFLSFHCVGVLPSSVNMVGVSRDGPWCVHS